MIQPIQFARHRPISALMLASGLILLGAVSATRVPVSLIPESGYPALSVEVRYSGVGPEKIEEILTRPLEESLSTVGGIEQIFSTSEEGQSKINLEFQRDTDLDRKSLEVREKVDLVSPGFPTEVQPPVVLRYDPSRRPVLIITLESVNRDLSELREIADREVKKALEGVDGVSEINVLGGKEREIIIACDKEALEAHQLSLSEVLTALRRRNVNRFAGEIEDRNGRIALYSRGRFEDIDDIKNTPVFAADTGRTVMIRDLGDASHSFRDQNSASRLNGEDRVSLYIYRAGKASLPTLSEDVKERLVGMEREDLRFEIRYDRAAAIGRAFVALGVAFSVGFIVVAFLLRRFLSFRGWEIWPVLVTVPSAILICSFFLFLFEFDFNLITISGLVLGSGLTFVFAALTMREGRTLHGLTRILKVLGLASALVAAIFLPIVFAGQEVQVVYGGIAVAVVGQILAGLFICAIPLPVFMRQSIQVAGRRRTLADRGVGSKRVQVQNYIARQVRWTAYFANRQPRYALIAALVVICLGMLAFRYSRLEYLSVFDKQRVTANLEFPSGTSFGATNNTAKKVEQNLLKHPAVEEINSRIDPSKATLRIKLKSDGSDEILDQLKEAAGKTDPAFLYFNREGELGGGEEITVDTFGDELDELNKITRALAKEAERIEGVNDVVLRYKQPRPELRLHIDKIKAEKAGATPSEIGDSVRLAIQGGVATRYVGREREIDIRVRFSDAWRRTLRRLKEFGVKTRGQDFVPLFEVVAPKEGQVPPKIYRKAKKRNFSFSMKPRGITFEQLLGEMDRLKRIPLPENYRIEYGQDVERRLDARRRIYLMFGLGLLLVYMLLASYFESYTRPFVLLLPVPVPAFVSICVLFLLGISLSVPVLIGLLLLAILVVIQSTRLMGLWDGTRAVPGHEGWKFHAREMITPAVDQEKRLFVQMAIMLTGFLLPLSLIWVEGGEILRGISVTLLSGVLVSAVTTPALAGIGYSWFLRRAEGLGWLGAKSAVAGSAVARAAAGRYRRFSESPAGRKLNARTRRGVAYASERIAVGRQAAVDASREAKTRAMIWWEQTEPDVMGWMGGRIDAARRTPEWRRGRAWWLRLRRRVLRIWTI